MFYIICVHNRLNIIFKGFLQKFQKLSQIISLQKKNIYIYIANSILPLKVPKFQRLHHVQIAYPVFEKTWYILVVIKKEEKIAKAETCNYYQ